MDRKKLRTLVSTGDSNFAEVLHHSSWAIVMLVIVTFIQFIFDLSLTHRFKAHGAGIFYLCVSVLMILALVGRLGLEQAVIRFIPPLLKDSPEKAAGVKRSAIRLSLSISIPLGLLLFFLSPYLANHIFRSSELTTYLRISALAVPALSINYVLSGVLRALKQTRFAISIERMTMYAFGFVSIWTLGILFGIKGVVIGFVGGIYLSTIMGNWHIKHHLKYRRVVIPFNKKRMLIVSIPLLFTAFSNQLNGQASVLLLGHFSTSSDVGIFNIALKISMLMNLILTAINVIAGAQISELYAAHRFAELRKIIQKMSSLGAFCGILLFLILAIFPHFWLGLFGSTFKLGAGALIILTAGQLINVSVGAASYVLAMTGHERALASAVAVSLLLNIGLGFILIPAYGVNGAGIAASGTIATASIIMVIMVRRYVGVWSLPFKYLGVWAEHFKLRGA